MATTRESSISRPLPGPLKRLEDILAHPGNKICADCGCPDPKWVSTSLGAFICIKCSGVHRSLGVHISKVLSVKLDEWTEEEVDSLEEMGGNAIVNMKYEAFLPENYKKPSPDSSIEERSDFIRKKYALEQFSKSAEENASTSLASPSSSSHNVSPTSSSGPSLDKKRGEKQHTSSGRLHGLGHAFRNSRKKKVSEQKTAKINSMVGMVEFVGLIKVNVVRGTNLAVRDMTTSDPYVIITMGNQSLKTHVVKRSLNPVWNESLMLSIPEPVPRLKLQVYDKDTFSTDDHMGEAEIDIQPLISAAKAYENSTITESMPIGTLLADEDSTLVKDSTITIAEGKVKQEITLRLQYVECGELEIELECVPLSQ
ncbi:probable ADP-ribosylation factor GTPase-activating protein AGD11 isoform X2 [Magnolia sinica]|uniref:probable ADP-ribosylation factor GTPase-activating protein AGD11 isoform X2 n=1 Tax=Magnolia sinica TaxID=86752 RepID=UPI00265AC67E|nr:probable ADP-ribosylation factor GTPase-activating protein AGD11 isoform X2 [Magnolia sinica]